MRSILSIFLFILQASFIFGQSPIQLICVAGNATCVVVEARDMFASFVNGSSSLHTQPLDPMYLDYMHIDNGFKLDLRDIEITGLKNAVIEKSSVDMSEKIFRIDYVSDFVLKSQYVTGGNLISIPIGGKGRFLLKYNNVYVELIMPFDIIQDAVGNDVMMLKSHSYTYDVRDSAQIIYDDLYDGNKTASDALHKVIDENWKSLTVEYGPYLFDVVNARIFNSIFYFARARPLKEYLEY